MQLWSRDPIIRLNSPPRRPDCDPMYHSKSYACLILPTVCPTGRTKRLHDTIVGPTSRTEQSDRPVGPTIVLCKRPVSYHQRRSLPQGPCVHQQSRIIGPEIPNLLQILYATLFLRLTAIFRWTWVSLYRNVSSLDFVGANDDGSGELWQLELQDVKSTSQIVTARTSFLSLN